MKKPIRNSLKNPLLKTTSSKARCKKRVMKKHIIAVARGGLCNRLKCLISSIRLADKYSMLPLLSWPVMRECGCKFSDLFENKISEISLGDFQKLENKRTAEKKHDIVETWRLEPLPGDKIPGGFSQIFCSKTGKNIDCEYGRIPLLIRKNFLAYVHVLVPQKYVAEEVSKFCKNFDDHTVSVNIRSWADEYSKKRVVLFNIDNFFAVMDKVDCSNFFVTCDSQEVLDELIYRYGKRILHYPKRTFECDRGSTEGVQDALIDLLLLSKNSKLIATPLSTFSEMAWWFGDCKANVEVVQPRAFLFKRVPGLGYSLFWKWHFIVGNERKGILPNFSNN